MEHFPVHLTNRLWAIQLSNSEYREWQGSNNFEILIYNWSNIEISGDSSFRDISIAVAKKYPRLDIPKIKNIAYGIYYYARLRVGDGILGTTGGKRVEKIGYVNSNNWNSQKKNSAEININWIKEIESLESHINIFDDQKEIERVNKKMILSLKLPFEFSEMGAGMAYDFGGEKIS